MRAHFVHATHTDNDDYGCGAHTPHHDRPAPSKGVQEWQDRHGWQNPVTGALHPKADSSVRVTLSWPTRQYSQALHERVYEVLAAIRLGRPVSASRRVLDGIDERTDPNFQAMLRFLKSPEWRRSALVQQLYPATKGAVANRQSHGIDTAVVAGTMALHLGLDPWLAIASGLAHDPGHSLYGHRGEETIDEAVSGIPASALLELQAETDPVKAPQLWLLSAMPDGMVSFGHASAGAALVRRPHILYTVDAADCIGQHSWSLRSGMSAEAILTSLADPIAYMTSDLRDILTVGVIPLRHLDFALPRTFQLANLTGARYNELSARLGPAGVADAIRNAFTEDVIQQFLATNEIGFSPLGAAARHELRSFIPERTFRQPGHQSWQSRQGEATEFAIAKLTDHYRAAGRSAEHARLAASAQMAAMDDRAGTQLIKDLGFADTHKIIDGPPQEAARVVLISRPSSKSKQQRLPNLADVLPTIEVADGFGRVGRMTVPEALLALRVAEFMPAGKQRTLPQTPLKGSGPFSTSTISVPGRGTSNHQRFITDVRRAIAKVLVEGSERHRSVGRRQSRIKQEVVFLRGMEALLKADVELPRAISEHIAGRLESEDLCDAAVRACEAYTAQHFAGERRPPRKEVDQVNVLQPSL